MSLQKCHVKVTGDCLLYNSGQDPQIADAVTTAMHSPGVERSCSDKLQLCLHAITEFSQS